MIQFQHDEKQFLESYYNFTVNIRPYIIKRLCDDYKKATNQEEKDYLHVLALEQWLLLFETLEGFFRAIKNRKRKSVFVSLNEDINIHNLHHALKNKSEMQILKELEIDLNKFPKEQSNKILARIAGIAGLWSEEKYINLIDSLIPVFNKLKHKLLIYKEDGELVIALNEKQQQLFKKVLKDSKTKSSQLGELKDISAYEELAEHFKAAIKDLVVIRLLELK